MNIFRLGQHYANVKAVKRPLKLSDCLGSVDSPAGRRRVAAYLESRPFPHFQSHPKNSRLLVRINEDGTCTTGRFVNREFKAIVDSSRPRSTR